MNVSTGVPFTQMGSTGGEGVGRLDRVSSSVELGMPIWCLLVIQGRGVMESEWLDLRVCSSKQRAGQTRCTGEASVYSWFGVMGLLG